MAAHQVRRIGYISFAALALGIFLAWQASGPARVEADLKGEGAAAPAGGGDGSAAPASKTPRRVAVKRAAHKRTPVAEFDAAAVDADPDYFRRSDAARFWQYAPVPAGKVRHPMLELTGDPSPLVRTGEWVRLAVKAAPRSPVTFLVLDAGEFSNGSHTVTVRSGEDGTASAEFRSSEIGNLRVAASCPLNTGKPEFLLRVIASE